MALAATADVTALHRRTLRVVVASQLLGGAGLAAGVTVGALLAQDMLGGAAVAGLPAALLTLGSAIAAFTVGRVSQRVGRRIGLAGGFITGALGAVGIIAAAVREDPVLLFLSLFVYGAGSATNLQARYAGTDLAPAHRRATSVSIAMVATTFGAVLGPNSVAATGRLAEGWGLPVLTGPFLLAGAAYAAAGLVLFAFLRPDPLLVARSLPVIEEVRTATEAVRSGGKPSHSLPTHPVPAGRDRALMVGVLAMVLTQVAMVGIMTMTPVHMRSHGHGLSAVGFVISVHIAAMYLPSLLTGALVDRVGTAPVVVAAGTTLLAAGLVASVAPGDSLVLLTVALALLGIGWNMGLIAGTALVIAGTTITTRARTQGQVDVLVALAGASGGAASGWVVASTDYSVLSLSGGLLSLLLIPAVMWSARSRRA